MFRPDYLAALFPLFEVEKMEFIGINNEKTNWLSAALMDFAGNPYGTYHQAETCIKCGNKLKPPPDRSLAQLIATKLAIWIQASLNAFSKPRGNWIHVLFRKPVPHLTASSSSTEQSRRSGCTAILSAERIELHKQLR
ncbi:MAG: hypothetical protein JO369_09030 [Paucibacter sp.]|nr:hypothetical protein [Roseateles sp.]